MRSKKQNRKRRPHRSRPGSVLILVIALLVLLALIGTAFLSTTQTERYSSQQNSVNTQADLLLQGLIDSTNSAISASLFASNGSGLQYRPAFQEMPTYIGAAPTAAPAIVYHNYDSPSSDPFLGPRWPDNTAANGSGTPFWTSLSYPLYADGSGSYSYDSPFEGSAPLYLASNKGQIQAYPSSRIINGQIYPAMLFFIPAATYPAGTNSAGVYPAGTGVVLQQPGGPVPYSTTIGLYLTPGGVVQAPALPSVLSQPPYNTLAPYTSYFCYAASAAGDGIADGGMAKIPVGEINNITYYYTVRCIDNNSAINASSAWSVANDFGAGTTKLPNYGFFQGNIGLTELLSQTPFTGAPSALQEMAALNTYRFGGAFAPATGSSPSTPPTIYNYPIPTPDAVNPAPPANVTLYSQNDALFTQMTRRSGNPGYGGVQGVGPALFNWLGSTQSSALAYRFSLTNPNASLSYIEQLLPNELISYNNVRSTPYSPAQVAQWNSDLFVNHSTAAATGGLQYAMRTILTGDNPVSIATPSRFGNASASAPVAWTNAGTGYYNFGDWVVDGPVGNQRSFVCIRRHLITQSPEPEPGATSAPFVGYNSGAVGYWAGAQSQLSSTSRYPGLPFIQQPVKTSVNTATFEELYLAFAQVMTDSIGIDNQPQIATGSSGTPVTHWQPPMQAQVTATATEQQLPMFRSVLRDNKGATAGKALLTAAQMLKLRAALAAVNTLDLRDGDNDVTSRHIVLDDSYGNPQYDVEVYGTEMQPYISEVVLQTDGTQTGSYFAIKLVNPYNVPIPLDNWQIGSVTRSLFPLLTMGPGIAIPPGTKVPAASGNLPGVLILYDGQTVPQDIQATITSYETAAGYAVVSTPAVLVAGMLQQALPAAATTPNEVYLMRPRLAGTTGAPNPTSQNGAVSDDKFNETKPSIFLADYVPADQIDLTGLQIPTPNSSVFRYDYRRGSDSSGLSNKAWNFVYPGYYDPAPLSANVGRYFSTTTFNATTQAGEGAGTAAFVLTQTGPNTTTLGPTNLGGADGGAGGGAGANPNSTYTTVPIELNNLNMGGPNKLLTTNTKQTFPFGGFARNADMMQIPFIGAYRIRPYSVNNSETNAFTELNSVTMDSALANDISVGVSALPTALLPNNPTASSVVFNEQIGRFCPIGSVQQTAATPDPTRLIDFGTGYATTDATKSEVYWHYHWTRKLFTYLTVQGPQDDFFPNVDPTQADATIVPSQPAKYPGLSVPNPIANANSAYQNAQTGGKAEDTVGVQGLININTAPVPVLAALPWTIPYNAATNLTIAQGIVAYRIANGPFKATHDLYLVPAIQGYEISTLFPAASTTAAGPNQGEFSPNGIPGSVTGVTTLPAVHFDFQDHFLLLNNVSNLITTRSDSFTCYVLLQGWRNAGTGNPTLAVQRRAAFIVDRNAVTPSNTKPTYSLVPSSQ